jgi:hypothetical protein
MCHPMPSQNSQFQVITVTHKYRTDARTREVEDKILATDFKQYNTAHTSAHVPAHSGSI